MSAAWLDDAKRRALEEVLTNDRIDSITAREWFASKVGGGTPPPRELNRYDAAALSVFRVLLETDVRIVRTDRLLKQYVEGHTCEDPQSMLLSHDVLWTISLASDVETRQLQIIATSWGNKDYPRPGPHYARSPVVVQNWDVPIPEWIAEWTY